MEDQDMFDDIYPCSCGHCSSCGINFIATPEEERRWAYEDANPQWEQIDGEWFKLW